MNQTSRHDLPPVPTDKDEAQNELNALLEEESSLVAELSQIDTKNKEPVIVLVDKSEEKPLVVEKIQDSVGPEDKALFLQMTAEMQEIQSQILILRKELEELEKEEEIIEPEEDLTEIFKEKYDLSPAKKEELIGLLRERNSSSKGKWDALFFNEETIEEDAIREYKDYLGKSKDKISKEISSLRLEVETEEATQNADLALIDKKNRKLQNLKKEVEYIIEKLYPKDDKKEETSDTLLEASNKKPDVDGYIEFEEIPK